MPQPTIAEPEPRPPRPAAGLLPALDRLPVLSLPVLSGVLVLRTVLLFALVGIVRLVGPAWPDGLIMTNALIMIVDAVTIGVVIMVLRRGRSPVGLGALLGSFRPVDALWSLLVLVILTVGFLAASLIGNLVAYSGPPPTSGGIAVPLWVGLGAVPAALTIGLAEEAIYRGVAQDQLTRRVGRPVAWLITAVFFALQHVPLALTSGPAMLAKVIMTFGVGLLLGGLVIWLRRLWPLVLAHALIDLYFLSLPTLLVALS